MAPATTAVTEAELSSPAATVSASVNGGTGQARVQFPYRGMSLDDLYGNRAGSSAPRHPGALCELNLMYTGNCEIESGKETWRQCSQRIGPRKLDHILNERCRSQQVWKDLVSQDSGTDDGWQQLSRGFVFDAETYADDDAVTYVPPSQRVIAKYQPARHCRSGCSQYPISFAVPAANVAKRVSRDKWWGFLPYVPGTFPFGGDPKYHFGYQDEWLKDQLHQHSYFAWTHKRGGWDCMRHLEILAAGAIPYFADIELCPRMSLANYPKALIKAAMALQGVAQLGRVKDPAAAIDSDYMVRQPFGHVNFKKPGAVDQERFDRRQYFELADAILNHTRHHMTTAAVVAYVLQTIGYEEPNHALVIGRWTYDYLHQTIESGLSDLGIRTTVLGHARRWVQKIPFESAATTAELELHRAALAKQSGHSVLPGLGWLYGFRTDPEVVMHANVQRNDAAMSRRIAAGEFDLVIYTYTENEPVHRRWYWGPVERGIPKQRRVFLHHNDDVMDPDPGSAASCNHGWLFKREMRDTGC